VRHDSEIPCAEKLRVLHSIFIKGHTELSPLHLLLELCGTHWERPEMEPLAGLGT
jgi:hypothetical protein